MKNPLLTLFMCSVFLFMTSCTTEKNESVSIAINPWPGYEFLYLAEKKGYFEIAGANITLVQMGSLADAQRAYISGQVDGMASTIIEAVQAQPLGGKPLKIVMVPDYSNGGDSIISSNKITSFHELKGKRIGCEISSLGIYILQRALVKNGLTLDDVSVVNTEQLDGEQALLNGNIDAFVTYPPVALDILKHKRFKKIFSSAEIPGEIIDTISISDEVLIRNPNLVSRLHNAWQMAIDYSATNKSEAYAIMAKREGISSSQFEDALSDLQLQDKQRQKEILDDSGKMKAAVISVCQTLVHVDALNADCSNYPEIHYTGHY